MRDATVRPDGTKLRWVELPGIEPTLDPRPPGAGVAVGYTEAEFVQGNG